MKKRTKEEIEKFVRFADAEGKHSKEASSKLLKIISDKKMTLLQVRNKMFEKTGLKLSEPTFLKCIHDPYHMNIYELKALSNALNVKNDLFINIVFGWVKIQSHTSIDAIPSK